MVALAAAGIPRLTPEKADISCLATQPLIAIGVGATLSDGNTLAGMTTVAFRQLKAFRATQVADLSAVVTGNTALCLTPLRSCLTISISLASLLRTKADPPPAIIVTGPLSTRGTDAARGEADLRVIVAALP